MRSTIMHITLGLALLAGCAQSPSAETLRNQAAFSFDHGNYADAAADYQEVAYRYPGDWDAQYRLGLCCLELGQIAEARQALEIAYSRRPQDPAIADALAEAISRRGDPTDLFDFLQRRAEMTGTMRDYLRLAKYCIEVNDPDSARWAIEQAMVVTDRMSVEPHLAAADLAKHTGDTSEQFVQLQAAYRLNPRDPRVNSALLELGYVPGPTLGYTPTSP